MVKHKKLATLAITATLLTLLLAAGLARAADKPTVTETYSVAINKVGDAHVTDTIKYSKDDYAAIKKVASKKRSFLTRRFTDEDTKGELFDFNTDMMDDSNSVVITYDKPGMAYSTTGDFVLYGYSSKPTSTSKGTFTFEDTSTVNSEFTLFTDQTFKTTTKVTLPPGATGAHWDSQETALKYSMGPAKATYGFWSDQKLLFTAIFAVLFLVFAGLLFFVYTRAPVEAVAPPEHKFCDQCGGPLVVGEHFCTNCGAKV
jgi:hypothetical protein